ncbi:MAG: hypothetical protein KDA45_03785 [Planctomycetales bacterium]|nr:hypothetical protein [Planctomycetales bacterium]
MMQYSMWYWLNSAPEKYADDFKQMREIGCDTVCLAFGLDQTLLDQSFEASSGNHRIDELFS